MASKDFKGFHIITFFAGLTTDSKAKLKRADIYVVYIIYDCTKEQL